jgi:hypothetical protein
VLAAFALAAVVLRRPQDCPDGGAAVTARQVA